MQFKGEIMMKKHILILTAALLGICMTGCGDEDVQFNADGTNVSAWLDEAAAVASYASESAETDVPADETDISETETVFTTAPTALQTTAAQTAAIQTTAAAEEECRYSADDLVGEWVSPGTFGMRNNSMTVRADGTVILRYAAGGSRFGKLKIAAEEHPDGSCGYRYSVCDDDGEWIAFACNEQPVSSLTSGQDGEMQFVRISLEDVAAEKMNSLTFLMKAMSGGGGDLTVNRDKTVTNDNGTFALVTDDRYAFNSLSTVEFERIIEETASGTLRTSLKDLLGSTFLTEDDSLYVLISNAHGFQTFETAEGVKISEQTADSFTATTVASNQIDGTGTAHFVFDGVNWTIESYEFQ